MQKAADLGKDRIWSLVLKLAVPSMIAQFVTVLYSIVDRMYIGNIPLTGDTALAGVGVCGPIVTLLTSFGTLVGLGGAILPVSYTHLDVYKRQLQRRRRNYS